MNTNGFLMGTRIPLGWRYTLDAMRLLGIGGFPRRPAYQSRLEEALVSICAAEGCTAAVDESEEGRTEEGRPQERWGGQSRREVQPSLEEAPTAEPTAGGRAERCAVGRCSTAEVAALADLVDETEHAGQFARLFPPSSAAEFGRHRQLSECMLRAAHTARTSYSSPAPLSRAGPMTFRFASRASHARLARTPRTPH